MSKPVLFDYFRSSASYRVRIALNLKGLDYDRVAVNLVEGEQGAPDYRAINPQGFVPTLDVDGRRIAQSLAIIGWIDREYPDPPLLPAGSFDRAHVVAMAMTVACDIHPLNNLRVLNYLKDSLGHERETRDDWYRHWIAEGFTALEAIAAPRAGTLLFGDAPTVADICLVPQMFNARRFDVPLDAFPTLVRADAEACRLDAFASAHPDAIASSS